jgi:hypothetical protein
MESIKTDSFNEIFNNRNNNNPFFSQGFYHWVMFIISLHTRVREKLKIDFESFVILQVVVSHSLYQINKLGEKTYSELGELFTNTPYNKKTINSKLTFASVSAVLQLPRETVRRKIISLCKRNILEFDTITGIKIGSAYEPIYKKFVKQTTLDVSSVVKKWKKCGALNSLLTL